MDKDGTLEISYNEWRDFLLFHPTTDLREIMQYWRHSTVSHFLLMSGLPPPIDPLTYQSCVLKHKPYSLSVR